MRTVDKTDMIINTIYSQRKKSQILKEIFFSFIEYMYIAYIS